MSQAPSAPRRRTRRRKKAAAYRPSHGRLLRRIVAAPNGRRAVALDAVIVPTNRPMRDLPGLRLAARIAKARRAWLVIVCSDKAQAADVPRDLIAGLGCRVMVLDLDAVDDGILPELETEAHSFSWQWRRNDVGRKRNLGIVLAVLAGWRHILFLDDDVWPVEGGPAPVDGELSAALSEFATDDELRAVGWTLHNFDDNSVAGHARKLAGLSQDVFVGGAALAVDCDAETPFFPSVYNEDWLFLIALAVRAPRWDRSIAEGGRLHQLSYNPWKIKRACSEEQGDVLAEGLMNLLEEDGPAFWAEAREPEFWQAAIDQRRSMLGQITSRLQRGHPAADALAAAGERVDLVPDDFVRYVDSWFRDLDLWAGHLTALRPEDPGPEALMSVLRHGSRIVDGIVYTEEDLVTH